MPTTPNSSPSNQDIQSAVATPLETTAMHPSTPRSPTPRETLALDARQDKLMSKESVDGAPPSHALRRHEWRWLGIAIAALLMGAAAWALIRGVSAGAVIGFGLVSAILLLVAGAPVLGAGLLRGKEERTAKAKAGAQLGLQRTSAAPRSADTH
jgi:hypothetical protein